MGRDESAAHPLAPFIRPTSICSSISPAPPISFSSNSLRTHLHNGRGSTPLLSIRYALFSPRRRVYPSPAHNHPQRVHARTRQRFDVFPSYPLSFHTLAHSFALNKRSTPLFSDVSALFAKNQPGWGYPLQTSHSSGGFHER